MKFDVYCNDGSPLKVIPEYIYTKGVGGAELALMSWAQVMYKRGHRVRIYNDPDEIGSYDGVEYLPKSMFNPDEAREVFVVYRSPNPFLLRVKADYKIHWSLDQQTIGNFALDIFPFVDKVICISPYHMKYHIDRYESTYPELKDKITWLDLGVRLDDYNGTKVERIPKRCIFTSVPDRGLPILRSVWPEIQAKVPEASLVITSDYTLWGAPDPLNMQHRVSWLNLPGITFLGNVERKRLVQEQLAARILAYPCTYDELHCISASEAQVAGALPITSTIGALETTNEWGIQVPNNPNTPLFQSQFIEKVVYALTLGSLDPKPMQSKAIKRFDWNRICAKWEDIIEDIK